MTALDRLRTTAALYLTDTCTVTRPSDAEPVLDRTTGQLVRPAGVVLYTGVCSVQMGGGRSASIVTEADVDLNPTDYVVRLPHTATGIRRGDIVQIVTADNPDLDNGDELVVLRNDRRTRRATVMLPCRDRHLADPLPEVTP